MKTVEAQIIQSRIVACKKCGQKNRLHEQEGKGLYRCASCGVVMPNPFLWQQWLARVKGTGAFGVGAAICVIGLVIYTIYLQIQLGDINRQRDFLAKEASESRLTIEKLQNTQNEDRMQIKEAAAEVLQAENQLDRRRDTMARRWLNASSNN